MTPSSSSYDCLNFAIASSSSVRFTSAKPLPPDSRARIVRRALLTSPGNVRLASPLGACALRSEAPSMLCDVLPPAIESAPRFVTRLLRHGISFWTARQWR
ncbi:MAG: hypothetical protein ACT4P6_17665 [Gemmatimonadaceae bacterium]